MSPHNNNLNPIRIPGCALDSGKGRHSSPWGLANSFRSNVSYWTGGGGGGLRGTVDLAAFQGILSHLLARIYAPHIDFVLYCGIDDCQNIRDPV